MNERALLPSTDERWTSAILVHHSGYNGKTACSGSPLAANFELTSRCIDGGSGNMKPHWLILCALYFVAGWSVETAAAQAAAKPRPEPQLSSVFPLGSSQAARISVELRGQSLDNAYAVWFDCAAIRGEIKSIEPVKPEGDGKAAKGQPVLKVMAEFVVAFRRQLRPAHISSRRASWRLQSSAVLRLPGTGHG